MTKPRFDELIHAPTRLSIVALLAASEEISAPDDRTIRFRLKYPFPLLPDALAKTPPSICPIMPERLASTDPYKQVSEMVGADHGHLPDRLSRGFGLLQLGVEGTVLDGCADVEHADVDAFVGHLGV